MKALDFLNKHLNLLSDEDKIKLDLEYRKLQNAKLENEVTRANKNNKKDGLKIVIDYGDEDGDS